MKRITETLGINCHQLEHQTQTKVFTIHSGKIDFKEFVIRENGFRANALEKVM